MCPLCFFFGEGGLCALLFLVYEYHQGATSNLQDRNRDMAIAILQGILEDMHRFCFMLFL